MKKSYVFIGRVLFIILLPLMKLFLKRSERAYVAIRYKSEILLVKNWLARDTWRLPGGGIARGEKPVEAVIREIREELYLTLVPEKLTAASTIRYKTDGMNFIAHWFFYDCDHKPVIRSRSWEIIETAWFDNIPDDCSPEIKDLLSSRGY